MAIRAVARSLIRDAASVTAAQRASVFSDLGKLAARGVNLRSAVSGLRHPFPNLRAGTRTAIKHARELAEEFPSLTVRLEQFVSIAGDGGKKFRRFYDSVALDANGVIRKFRESAHWHRYTSFPPGPEPRFLTKGSAARRQQEILWRPIYGKMNQMRKDIVEHNVDFLAKANYTFEVPHLNAAQRAQVLKQLADQLSPKNPFLRRHLLPKLGNNEETLAKFLADTKNRLGSVVKFESQ